ncbi:hypothetical protein NC651_022704 [Populus alba x Populus x berolinensis]|nr:hypothetical protein NC651_022695 [Populus alba x Populus x berolinensis]KAJ6896594.1 hypothetical protein NC651_022704 [Populus alba x Populus x berolinensis]
MRRSCSDSNVPFWAGSSSKPKVKSPKDLNSTFGYPYINPLIGPKILLLAEVDAPPEDLVFHKFYKMNRTRDLNQTMNEDDEDLLRNVDSAEVDAPSDTAEGDDFGTINDWEMMT